jgi:predicted amidohydrolase YtcJ
MDKVLLNGNIETMAGRRVSALAIQNGRIAYAGSDEGALALIDSGTEKIDLLGCFAMPGFTDSHMHTLNTGQDMARLDLRGAKSVEEIVERGRSYISERNIPEGQWIVGFGFNHNTFGEIRLPRKEDLDKISDRHPILASRVCGHIATMNSLAIKLSGATMETEVPGGELDKENGELTGVIRENALSLAYSAMPELGRDQVESLLREATAALAASGLTAVHSDDLSSAGWADLMEAARSLSEKGQLGVRIYEECQGPTLEAIEGLSRLGVKTGYGNDEFQAVNIKILADGSLGAATAYLREGYADAPGERGIPIYAQSELDELVEAAHEAGFAVACHCIGDGALEMYLNALEKAIAKNPRPLRNRVVHCQIGSKELYEKMAALNVAADIQPPFQPTDAPIAERRVGAERAKESYAWKSLLETGIRLAGGSDSPVEGFSPLWGIYCAATRKDGSGAPSWMPEQKLTVKEAAELYTTGPAWLSASEHTSGTLETGKFADLVVLSEDIFAIDPERIKDVNVLLTIKGGQATYAGGAFA